MATTDNSRECIILPSFVPWIRNSMQGKNALFNLHALDQHKCKYLPKQKKRFFVNVCLVIFCGKIIFILKCFQHDFFYKERIMHKKSYFHWHHACNFGVRNKQWDYSEKEGIFGKIIKAYKYLLYVSHSRSSLKQVVWVVGLSGWSVLKVTSLPPSILKT